jgi:predicted MFS family arabinose efflux permease
MPHIGTQVEGRQFGNLALYFCGQGFSNLGSWIQQAAVAWLILKLAIAEHPGDLQAAGYYLGLAALIGQAPSLVLMPVSGVWADRRDRRRLIRLTQAAAALQGLVLAMLTMTGALTIAGLILLSLLLTAINAAAAPAMQGIVADLVEQPRDLPRAVAVSSSLSAGARLLGPAIGAGLLWAGGPTVCFLINAISFVPLLIVLPMLQVRPSQPARERAASWLAEWREAFSYVAASPPLRTVLVAVAGACLFGMSFYTLVPLVAAAVLRGDEATYSLLVNAVGLGGAAGVGVLIFRSRPRELVRWIAVAQVVAALALGGIAGSTEVRPILVLLVLAGFAVVLQLGAGNVLLHVFVADDKRGRVTSLYLLAFTGLTPLGGWLGGVVAGRYGVATALGAGAAGSLACALWYLRRLGDFEAERRPTSPVTKSRRRS